MDDKPNLNLEEVIEKYQNLIAEHPHTPEYHKELGNAFHKSGAFDLALEEYRTCLHIDSSYFPAQYNMGNCYFAMNKHQLAIIAWQKALIMNPQLEHAIYNIAYTYFKLGMMEKKNEETRRRYLDDALMEFQKAIKLRPKNKDTWLHLGLTWYELDHFDNAVSAYMEVLKLDSKDPDGHYNLGNVYYEKGFDDPTYFERAIGQYRLALKFNGKDTKSRNNIADCLIRLGRYADAQAEIEAVIAGDPNYMPAICTRSELYSQLGKHQEAIEGFKKIVEMDPESQHLLHKYASQKLIEEYTRVLRTNPGHHETHFELGRAYKDLGIAYRDRALVTKARDELKKALELGPGRVPYHVELAECYFRLNNTDQAIVQVEAALTIEPDSIPCHCLLGEIYVQVGDRELAQMEFSAIRRIYTHPNGRSLPSSGADDDGDDSDSDEN